MPLLAEAGCKVSLTRSPECKPTPVTLTDRAKVLCNMAFFLSQISYPHHIIKIHKHHYFLNSTKLLSTITRKIVDNFHKIGG